MIDIHSHILPFVDEGSCDIQASISMLKECLSVGVTDVILTPHYRKDYKADRAELEKSFDQLKNAVKENGLDIGLYLGQEFYIEKDFKKEVLSGKAVSFGKDKYLLIECSYDHRTDVAETVYELTTMGYIPIVAHIERYAYIDLDTAFEVKELGGLIQVNADSIADKKKKQYLKVVKKLLKHDLVDFVAGDLHDGRTYLMKEASEYVRKKYGSEREERLFKLNAQKIIK